MIFNSSFILKLYLSAIVAQSISPSWRMRYYRSIKIRRIRPRMKRRSRGGAAVGMEVPGISC